MSQKIITLDVRDDFRNGHPPFDKIQKAFAALAQNEALVLLVPFEPVPLYQVATAKGLGHLARQTTEGHWEVTFTRAAAVGHSVNLQSVPSTSTVCAVPRQGEAVELDARGLEPPQPMVKILEALANLPAGSNLCARTDRRPVHLYPLLAERGFAGQSEEQHDGSFITHINRS